MILHLFEGFGIELEYMIVHSETLNVAPFSDYLLHAVSGVYESEVEMGPLNWSNELVLHVIELKTNGPAAKLDDLPDKFAHVVQRINDILNFYNIQLLPTAMHPWMNPMKETRLWPHEYNAVYEAYNRIFGCQGHGWSNLQSLHINLPFADDDEFGKLHAAIRVVLPVLPALAASSPVMDGKVTGKLDNRLFAYKDNQKRVPSLAGNVIPEPLYTRGDYEEKLLQQLYRDIAPFDDDDILKHEWLNSRGAIARFDRNTIEIRVIDIQECPLADLAITAAIVELLKALIAERWCKLTEIMAFPTEILADILTATIDQADAAMIAHPRYLELFGMNKPTCTAGELWSSVYELELQPRLTSLWRVPLEKILQSGPLSRRILRAIGEDTSHAHLLEVYRQLSNCPAENRLFDGLK
ncbi:glutamate--cysteine ligase [candidate division KSB1 bacterium]|nr:glutamate--cysteine ligase [candidate division KSB1 bacterium]